MFKLVQTRYANNIIYNEVYIIYSVYRKHKNVKNYD